MMQKSCSTLTTFPAVKDVILLLYVHYFFVIVFPELLLNDDFYFHFFLFHQHILQEITAGQAGSLEGLQRQSHREC